MASGEGVTVLCFIACGERLRLSTVKRTGDEQKEVGKIAFCGLAEWRQRGDELVHLECIHFVPCVFPNFFGNCKSSTEYEGKRELGQNMQTISRG